MLVHIFFFLVLLGEEKEKGERQRGKRKTDIEVAECHTSLLLFSLVEKIYSSPIWQQEYTIWCDCKMNKILDYYILMHGSKRNKSFFPWEILLVKLKLQKLTN